MVVQPTGRVLVWSIGDNARVWDPATGQFTLTPATFGDLHCGAQATMSDGRTVVLGGVDVTPHMGITVTGLFDPFTNTWTQGQSMNYARWYGTATTLPDGRILACSGDDHNAVRVEFPEVYDPIANTWTVLTGAQRSQGLYPFMYVLPNGRVFEAATRTNTAILNLSSTGSWSNGPTNPFGSSSYAECGAMYAPGKILRAGGGDPAFARVSVIDMNAASPAWREIAPMAFPRRRHNVVILADGSLLVVGGTRSADDESQAILAAELWNPVTEQWSTMAAMTEARMYHSASALLPDGRVVSAGGEATGRLHAQVYSPPYLFKGARPTITSAPTSASYGNTFNITTPNASSIAKVILLRPCGVTHAIDMNERAVPLTFTAGSGSLTATAPASGNLAPPGYYMLVIVNTTGVPSIAAWLRLDSSSALSPGRVSGRVTNSGTGAGIANATVNYSGGSTTTRSDGTYDFAQVAPGEHSFSASATGYATSTRALTVTAGGSFVVDFALASPGSIQGRVTNAGTGGGIPATVSIEGVSTVADAAGNYTLTGLAAGSHHVSAAATGYYSADQIVSVTSGATTTANFALQELDPRILGEILDAVSQQPIPGVTVSYSGGVTTTDGLGRYVFTNVVPGTYNVTAAATGYTSVTQQAIVLQRAWTTADFALSPQAANSYRFVAVADAQVKSSNLTTNYGTLTTLRARAPDPEYHSFVKFTVERVTGAIRTAKLRLYATDDSNVGPSLYYVGSTWSEGAITWGNAPQLTGTPLVVGPRPILNTWIEIDVSSVVTGNGTYSFGLASSSTNSAYFSSREGAQPPELVVETSNSSTQYPNVSSFTPSGGPVGTLVTITGGNFVNVIEVLFNGTPSTSYTVDSSTQIRATVPSSATTGPVGVANANGTGLSGLPFTVTTSGGPLSQSFRPTDDAHVHSGNPTSNYGSLVTLRAKDETTDYRFYLRFNVTGTGGVVTSAKLRLFCTDPSPIGGQLSSVSNNLLGTSTPWTEGNINWNNSPALGTVAASVGNAAVNTWVEFDVTALVTRDGTYNFGVGSASTNSVYYSSKEGANPPVLVVQTIAQKQAEAQTIQTLSVFPNPTRDTVMIHFDLQQSAPVRVAVYDVAGHLVKTLFSGTMAGGMQHTFWDGKDSSGQRASSGVYFYRVDLGDRVRTGKILMQR